MKYSVCRSLLIAALSGPLMLAQSAIAADVEKTAVEEKGKNADELKEAPAKTPQYPASGANQIGDHLKLTVDVYGFVPVSVSASKKDDRCAGKYSKYSVVATDATSTYVKFYHIQPALSSDTCPKDAPSVAEGSIYRIANTPYLQSQSKTAGIAYGALVVPFKFRLGSDKKLISSVTIAPYIGGRLTWLQFLGYELMPVWAAGIGLVPVASEDGKSTDTKSAFSTAVGFTLSSVKDPKYSAGVLFGRDFISKSDQGKDPGVNKPWMSLWLGVAL
jgi:hypothetical protein